MLPNFHSPSLNVSPKTFAYPRKRKRNAEEIPRKSCKIFRLIKKMENINFYLSFELADGNIADGEL